MSESTTSQCSHVPDMSEISWRIAGNKTLIISGQGRIPDYNYGNNPPAPWKAFCSQIRFLKICEGITEIGMYAFDGYTGLKKVTLPSSLSMIHGYAFRGCSSLTDVTVPDNTEFMYLYEPLSEEKKNSKNTDNSENAQPSRRIFFSLQSFRDVPWAIQKWNGFYIKNNILYTCLSGKSDLVVIPENVTVLYDFCLKDMEIDRLEFPKRLKKAGRFICDKTVVNTALLPAVTEDASDYMFSNSLFFHVEFPEGAEDLPLTAYLYKDKIMGRGWNHTGKPIVLHKGCSLGYSSCRKYYGNGIRKYRLQLKPEKNGHTFPVPYDAGIRSIYTDKLFVGEDLLKKMKKGFILTGVIRKDNIIDRVESYVLDEYGMLMDDKYGSVLEYVMFPFRDQNEISTDNFLYRNLFPAYFACEFPEVYGKDFTRKAGSIRISREDETWFISVMSDGFAGSLELEILKGFLQEHSECRLMTAEENRQKHNERDSLPD